MFGAIAKQLTAETFTAISNERRDTKSFGRATALSDFDLADLYDLSLQYERMAPAEAAAVQSAILSAVYQRGNQEGAHGLSIYSPYYNKNRFADKWQSEYNALKISGPYSDYMEQYAGIWLGKPLGDWSSLTYQALPVEEDAQEVEFILTDDQLAHFASAKVIILQGTEQLYDTYGKVFESEALEPEGNVLRYSYDFRMLYAVNQYGRALTDPLYFENTEDYYLIPAMLEDVSSFNAMANTYLAYENGTEILSQRQEYTVLRCHREDNALMIDSYIFPDDVGQLLADHTNEAWLSLREAENADTAVFRYLNFNDGNVVRRLEKKSGEKIKPFYQWRKASRDSYVKQYLDTHNREVDFYYASLDEELHEFGSVMLNGPSWSFEFMKAEPGERKDLYAQFIVTDSQGNQTASELIPLNQENIRTKEINKFLVSRGNDDNFNIGFNLLEAVRMDEDEVKLFFTLTATTGSLGVGPVSIIPSVEINGIDAGVLHLETGGSIFDLKPDEEGGWASYGYIRYLVFSLSDFKIPLLSDGVIHSVRLKGWIDVKDEEAEHPFSARLLGEFDRTFDMDFDLSGFLNQNIKSSFVQSDGSIQYRINNLRMDSTDTIEGLLAVKNLSSRTKNIVFKNAEEKWPGVCINNIYIPDAWMDVEALELPAGEMTVIGFAIRIPRGPEGESFFTQWGIDQIHSVSFFVNENLSYGYMDGDTYHVVLTDFQKQDFEFPYGAVLPELPAANASRAPKWVMLGENAGVQISGVRWDQGVLKLELLLKNDGGTEMITPDLLLGKADVDFLIGSASVDGIRAVVRTSSERSNPVPSAWSTYSEVKHIFPRVYERCEVEIAAADGTAFPEDIGEIAIIFTYAEHSGEDYGSINSCVIRLAQAALPGTWTAEELEIQPSISMPALNLVLPDNPAQYAVTLTAELPQELSDAYEAGKITRAAAYIVDREAVDDNFVPYYTIYANPVADCVIADHSVSVQFPGMLLMPEGAKKPVYTEYEMEGDTITTRINRLLIAGCPLCDQWVDQIIYSISYRSDVRDCSSKFVTCSRNCDFSDQEKDQTILMERQTLGLVPLSGGVYRFVNFQYEQEQFAYQNKMPVFRYIPASDLSPMVLFAFQYADQTYSCFLVPYETACSH